MLLIRSVFAVTGPDSAEGKQKYGTAFVVAEYGTATYLISAAHVVNNIGAEKVRVAGRQANIIAIGPASSPFDVAVLQAYYLQRSHAPVRLVSSANAGTAYETRGFDWAEGGVLTSRIVRGRLLDQIGFQRGEHFVTGWDLAVDGTDVLKQGYSGAPVVLPNSLTAVAIITHSQNSGKRGMAISTAALDDILHDGVAELVRRLLYGSGRPRQGVAGVRKDKRDLVYMGSDSPESIILTEAIRLYPCVDEVARIEEALGLSRDSNQVGRTALERWVDVIHILQKNGGTEALLKIVSDENPQDERWLEAVLARKEHLRATGRGAQPRTRTRRVHLLDLSEREAEAEEASLVSRYLGDFASSVEDFRKLLSSISLDRSMSASQLDVALTPVKMKLWDLHHDLERLDDIPELPSLKDQEGAIRLRHSLRMTERAYESYRKSVESLIASGEQERGKAMSIEMFRRRGEGLWKELLRLCDDLEKYIPLLVGRVGISYSG